MWIQTPKKTNHEIKRDIYFHLFLTLMLKNPYFLCGVKIPDQQFLIFLSFMNTFSEAVIRRCSSKQLLLRILQHSESKRDSSASFFIEHLRWLLLHFSKSIKQPFGKDVGFNRFLKKCSVYDVLIIFLLNMFQRHVV